MGVYLQGLILLCLGVSCSSAASATTPAPVLGRLCPDVNNCTSLGNATCFAGRCVCTENYFDDGTGRCSKRGPLRLVNGSTPFEGRVEMYSAEDKMWTNPCDTNSYSYFTFPEGNVTCRALGFRGQQYVPKAPDHYGMGSHPNSFYRASCKGTEVGLQDCSYYYSFLTTSCSHSTDVGVNCTQAYRLRGGRTLAEGRVEVFYNGQWGTVCDDNFDIFDARVVCRALGFDRLDDVLEVRGEAHFGQGSGPIWLDDVLCLGSEQNFNSCRHDGWGKHDCNHTEDVGVVCSHAPLARLMQGMNDTSRLGVGRVEVYEEGGWGTVCHNDFDTKDARVVCNMLGIISDQPMVRRQAYYGEGAGVVRMADLQCEGTESSLYHCPRKQGAERACTHRQDVGVRCIEENTIRLVNGSVPWEGRLEVRYGNTWGTVCDDGFGPNEAAVVCRSLQFVSDGALAFHGARYGEGRGPIFLDEVHCNGHEGDLSDCQHMPWGHSDCTHREDVGVYCKQTRPVRLVNGSSSGEGRVEVLVDQAWGTVCDEDFDEQDAKVVCRMLGFSGEGEEAIGVRVMPGAYYGEGKGHVLYANLECRGNEVDLDHCPHKTFTSHTCHHDRDVGVSCTAGDEIIIG